MQPLHCWRVVAGISASALFFSSSFAGVLALTDTIESLLPKKTVPLPIVERINHNEVVKQRYVLLSVLPETRPVRDALFLNQPALSATPGSPRPWHAGRPVYSGVVNLASGNLLLNHHVTGWSCKGYPISFGLFFNSQSNGSNTLGPKWSHSYDWKVTGTSPAVVTAADGTQTSFSSTPGGYVAPAGIHEALVQNSNSSWTLTFKGGAKFHFDSTGKLTSQVDRNGNTTTLTYTSGNLSSVTDAANRSLTIGYSSGKISSVIDCESRTWTFAYDGSGRLDTITDPTLNGQTYSTGFVHDSNNNVSSLRNRLNHTWVYSYGTGNTFASMTDSNNEVWGTSYSAGSAQTPSGTPSGTLATPGTPTQPPAPTMPATSTDPTGIAVQYNFDSSGRLVSSQDATGDTTSYIYDSNNNLTTMVLPGSGSPTYSYTYDSRGNNLTVTDPLGGVTTRTYDSNDNMLSITDASNHTTTHAYNTAGDLISTTDGTNNTTTYGRNNDGTLASVTDAANKTTTFTRDTAGNVLTETDPLNYTTTYTYTINRMVSRVDARSRTTTYSYDAWGRNTGTDYPTSGDISLTHDAEGRLTQAVDGTGTRTFTYDAWGHKLSQTDPRGTTTATYDDGGRLTSQTDVNGRIISYAYDSDGRLAAVGDANSSASYTYDAQGRVSTETFSNGVKTYYGYDASGRTTSLQHKKGTAPNETLIVGYAATYDSAGHLTQITESPSGAVTSYTFDNDGRLLTENRTNNLPYTSTFAYNSRGLRTSSVRSENAVTSQNATYSYDNAGRLTSVVDGSTTTNYTWNNDGTLASYPASGYTRKLEYDEEGRLIRIQKDFGGGNVTTAFEYAYGYDGGRRLRKDHASGVWTWYPCGVACCAGELTELQSTNNGSTWTTASDNLVGLSPVRTGSSWTLKSLDGTSATFVDGSGNTIGQVLQDREGLMRQTSGSIANFYVRQQYGMENDELHASALVAVMLEPVQGKKPDPSSGARELCMVICSNLMCVGLKGAAKKACERLCKAQCSDLSPGVKPVKGVVRGCIVGTTNESDCVDCCRAQCPKTYPKPGSLQSSCLNGCIDACNKKYMDDVVAFQ